jgi:hypothetical protein
MRYSFIVRAMRPKVVERQLTLVDSYSASVHKDSLVVDYKFNAGAPT